jgi:hypothetical protein
MDRLAIRLSALVPTFRSSCDASARTFHELRKVMGTSKSTIRVPLLRLKFLEGICRLRCRNFKWAVLVISVTALVVVPIFMSTGADAGTRHAHVKKHARHWRDAGPGFGAPYRPFAAPYAGSGEVCPGIGRSFECKIWPPPIEDDPDRKTSKY